MQIIKEHCDSDYNQKSNNYADYDRSRDIRIVRQEPRVGGKCCC
jgi:hypothetical protein